MIWYILVLSAQMGSKLLTVVFSGQKGNPRPLTSRRCSNGRATCAISPNVYDAPCVGSIDSDGDGNLDTAPLDESGSCPEGYLALTGFCGKDTNRDSVLDDFQFPSEDGQCPLDYASMYVDLIASCTNYERPTWVFSIEAFVKYLWGIENDGLRHLQVRFYPNCAF